jgi:hypothetical protein
MKTKKRVKAVVKAGDTRRRIQKIEKARAERGKAK